MAFFDEHGILRRAWHSSTSMAFFDESDQIPSVIAQEAACAEGSRTTKAMSAPFLLHFGKDDLEVVDAEGQTLAAMGPDITGRFAARTQG